MQQFVVAKPFNSHARRFKPGEPNKPAPVTAADVAPLDFERLKERGFVTPASSDQQAARAAAGRQPIKAGGK